MLVSVKTHGPKMLVGNKLLNMYVYGDILVHLSYRFFSTESKPRD